LAYFSFSEEEKESETVNGSEVVIKEKLPPSTESEEN